MAGGKLCASDFPPATGIGLMKHSTIFAQISVKGLYVFILLDWEGLRLGLKAAIWPPQGGSLSEIGLNNRENGAERAERNTGSW